VIVNLADPAWVKGTQFTRDVKGASCFADAVVNKGRESHGCFLMSWEVHP